MTTDESPTLPITGWRVIYFLNRSPWVREEPVGAFRVHEHHATPMIREKGSTSLVDVDEDRTPYALAHPGEPASAFIEQAKEHVREHKRWLKQTREKRAEEKKIQLARIKFNNDCAEFERAGREIPHNHPAHSIFPKFSWHIDIVKEAGFVSLAWFLSQHCFVDQNQEVALDPFKERLSAFLASYELPTLGGPLLVRAMGKTGLESLKHRGKIDGWKGIGLRDVPSDEEASPPEGTDESRYRQIASSVFAAHCIERSRFEGSTSYSKMLLVFRCWCIRFRVQPFSARDFTQAIRLHAPLSRSAGSSGEREFQGVVVSLPRPDRFVYATERTRRRSIKR